MLLIATLGKTIINLAIFSLLRLPWAQALLTALVLSQVGEFSFLLGSVGLERGIIEIKEFRIILTVTAVSLAISPLWMGAVRRLHDVVTHRQVPVRYVFRIAFGREADQIVNSSLVIKKLITKSKGLNIFNFKLSFHSGKFSYKTLIKNIFGKGDKSD